MLPQPAGPPYTRNSPTQRLSSFLPLFLASFLPPFLPFSLSRPPCLPIIPSVYKMEARRRRTFLQGLLLAQQQAGQAAGGGSSRGGSSLGANGAAEHELGSGAASSFARLPTVQAAELGKLEVDIFSVFFLLLGLCSLLIQLVLAAVDAYPPLPGPPYCSP